MQKLLDDSELRSEDVNDILSQIPNRLIRWGTSVLTIIVFFLMGGTWFIQYPSIIKTEGIITSLNPPQKIIANRTGEVDSILLLNNDFVKKGQLIGFLETVGNYHDISELNIFLEKFSLTATSYYELHEFKDFNLGVLQKEFSEFEFAVLNYHLFDSLNGYENKIEYQKLNEQKLQERLKNTREQLNLIFEEKKLIDKQFNRNRILLDKGVISAHVFEKEKLQVIEKEIQIENLKIRLNEIKALINDIKSGLNHNSLTFEIEKKGLENKIHVALNLLKVAISEWKMENAFFAQIDGQLVFLDARHSNQVVYQNSVLFAVLPARDDLFAQLKAPIRNSGRIMEGQKVQISLVGFPKAQYGIIDGKISTITPIFTENEFYYVEVNLNNGLITNHGIEIPYNPQLKITAEIITEDLRLVQKLFYQFRYIFS